MSQTIAPHKVKPLHAVATYIDITKRTEHQIDNSPFIIKLECSRPVVIATYVARTIAALCLLASNARSTLLFVSVSGDKVVLAADGMSVHPGSAKLYTTHCKIVQQNNMFFAIAGLEDYSWVNFNAPSIVRKTWIAGRGFLENVAAFERAVDAPLHAAWDHMKTSNRSQLPLFPGPVMDIVFVGKETHGQLIGVVVGFQEVSGQWRKNPRRTLIGDFVSTPTFTMDGDWRIAQAYIATHPEIQRLDMASFFRIVLRESIARQPPRESSLLREIDEPISILEIPYKGQPQWIERGACLEVKAGQNQPQQQPNKK